MERILGGLPMTQPLTDIPPVEEPILGGDVRSIFRPEETALDKAKGVADAGLSLFGALVHGVPAQFMGAMGPEFQAKRFRPPQTPAGERYFDIAAEALGKVGEAFPMQPSAFTSPVNVLAAPAMAQAGAKAADINAMAQRALQAAGGRLEKAVEKQVYSTMEKGGLPAEILQGMTQGTRSFMAQPQRVEAPRNEMKMYSPAEEAALNLQRGQGRGEGFLNDLKKSGVKDEELEYTGLKDFLAGKQNVSKKEIQDFLAGNKVQISETQLGHRTRSYEGLTNQIDELREKIIGAQEDFQNSGYLFRDIKEDSIAYPNSPLLNDLPFEWQFKYDKIVNMKEMLEKLEKERYDLPKGEPTKYSRFTLPGGENYREILLTLPQKAIAAEQKEAIIAKRKQVFDEYNPQIEAIHQQMLRTRDRDEYNKLFDNYERLSNERDKVAREVAGEVPDEMEPIKYQSSHWDQPNVLAHLRVNDRVDADGKKMLLIEEIQSDWHQAGREKGYAGKSGQLPTGWEVVEVPKYGYRGGPQIGTEFMVFDRSKTQVGIASPTREGAIANATGSSSLGVPDAPFKEDWYQLALKRALQEAVDKGYDRVGLLTGARQADRYDLSKQVDYIDYVSEGPDKYRIAVVGKDGQAVNLPKEIFTTAELENYVGREVAQKIINGEGQSDGGRMTLRGPDLRVGGEGMKKYYDEIYPGFLNKYGKKFDAKVGDTALQTKGEWPFPIEIASDGKQYWLRSKDPSRSDAATVDVSKKFDSYGDADKARDKLYAGFDEPVRYIDITPKMKEALSKGQPMFKEGGLVSSDAISSEASLPDDPFRSGRPLLQRTRRPATQEENETLNRAVLQGAANMPYNLIGAPADIGNLLLTPLGLGSEQPVLGSDWIKQKMTDLGVRPEAPTDPTQRALYSAADIGSSLVNPAAPVRAVARGAEKVGAAIGRELAPKVVEPTFQESGLVSNTDTIKARLIEQGMPEDKAFMQALKLANEKQMADSVPANVQRQLNEPLIVEEPLSANTRSGALPGQQRTTPAKSASAIDDGAGSVESVQFVKLPDGRFATSTAFQQTRSVAVGFDQASTPGQAAHITAGLRKSPQEQLVAVVLDENDRPIQIIRHTVGLASQASAEPFSLLGAIANTPKAKSFWISHNHPSGNPELSSSDKNLANAINNISRGTGIEMRGILAIGKSKYAAYSPDGSIDISNNSIPAAARTKSIDMVERTFRKTNLLDSTKIQTPEQARDVAQKIAGDETGLILFNAAYQPVAFVPLTNINVGTLRQTGVAKQLLGSLEKANATATMYVSKSNQNIADLPNLAKMLEQAQSPMIDALVGDKLESLEMANKLPRQSVDFKSVFPIAGAATGAAIAGLENNEGMAKGGLAGLKNLPAAARAAKAGKAVKPVDVLPPEESQANLDRFLEGSKVRERLYHATPKNFSEFKPGGEDPTLSGPAMWFSTDSQKQPAMHNISGGREGQFRGGVNVMPVYVQAKNPLVLDDPVMLDWAQTVFAGGSREFPELLAPKWVEEIRKEGYDSIIFADPYGKGRTQEVIMFQPEKIKSAIGNRGTYDVSERDITKAKGGLAAMNRK